VYLAGLLGCCGSLTQNRCALLLYFSLVTIIFIGEIALAIAVYYNKDEVTKSIRSVFATSCAHVTSIFVTT
jgi:heme O synthase-like polyprenyltransferase